MRLTVLMAVGHFGGREQEQHQNVAECCVTDGIYKVVLHSGTVFTYPIHNVLRTSAVEDD